MDELSALLLPVAATESEKKRLSDVPLGPEPSDTVLWVSGDVQGKSIPNPLEVFSNEAPWVIEFEDSQVPISTGFRFPGPEAFRDLALDLEPEPIAYLLAKDLIIDAPGGEGLGWVIQDYQVYTLGYSPSSVDPEVADAAETISYDVWNAYGLGLLAMMFAGSASAGRREDPISIGAHRLPNAVGDEDTAIALSGLSIDGLSPSQAVTVTLAVTEGQLQLDTEVSGGLSATQVSGNNSSRLILTGSVLDINTTLKANGGLVFIAPPEFSGEVGLSMQTVGDRVQVADSEALIEVAPVNDAPVNTIADAVGDEDTSIALMGLSISDVDASGDVTVRLSVGSGDFTVLVGATGVELSGDGTSTIQLTGTVDEINALLESSGGLSYLGVQDFSGTDTLTMVTTDDAGLGALSEATITVNEINDAPEIVASDVEGLEDTVIPIEGLVIGDVDESGLLTVTLSVEHGQLAFRDDVSGGFTSETLSTEGGSLTVTATLAQLNATLDAPNGLTYVGNSNFSGEDQLSVSVTDSSNALSEAVADISVRPASRGGLGPGGGPFVVDESLVIEAFSLDGRLLARVQGTEEDELVLTASELESGFPEIDESGTRISAGTTGSEMLPVLDRLLIDFGLYYGPSVFVVRKGSQYVDESTGELFPLDQALRGFLDIPEGDKAYVGVTPLSEAAFRAIERSAGVTDGFLSFEAGQPAPEGADTLVLERFDAAAELVKTLTGVDIEQDLPVLVNTSQFLTPEFETTEADNQYGMKLAALSESVRDRPPSEKIQASVDLLLNDLNLSASESEPIKVGNTVALVENQVAVTEAFVSFRDTGLAEVQPDLAGAEGSAPVVDLTPPRSANLTEVEVAEDRLSVSGSVDLIDQLNQSGVDDLLQFRVLIPEGVFTVTLDELDSVEPTVNQTLADNASASFVIEAYDSASGVLEFSVESAIDLDAAPFSPRFVVVDPAAHATVYALPLTAPVVDITLSSVVLEPVDQAEVTFSFDQAITGFSLENIVVDLEGVSVTDLEPVSDRVFKAVLTTQVEQTFSVNTLSVVADAVTSVVNGRTNSDDETVRYLIREDVTRGEATDDTQVAEDGEIALAGGGGDDSLVGGQTDILLDGDTGDDLLVGGLGNDTLIPGDDDDLAFGGLGDDLYYADVFGQFAATQSWFAGGEGIDQAVFVDPVSAYRIALASEEEVIHLNTLVAQEVSFRGVKLEGLVFDPSSPVARVEYQAAEGSQIHYIQAESMVFFDTTLSLDVFVGVDPQLFDYWDLPMIAAEADSEGVTLNALRSDREQDDFGLSGSDANDTLIGGLGLNLLQAGGGDDALMSITGDDVLLGEGGQDTFWVSAGPMNASPQEVLVLGGAGSDQLVLFDAEQTLNEPLIVWQPAEPEDSPPKVIRFGDFELGVDTVDLQAIFGGVPVQGEVVEHLQMEAIFENGALSIDLAAVSGVTEAYQHVELVLFLGESVTDKENIDFNSIFIENPASMDPFEVFSSS